MKGYVLLKKEFSNIFDELFPNLDDISEIINDSSSIARGLLKTNELIIKHKFNIFIDNLEFTTQQKINDFLNDIKDNENKKIIFIECIKKSIDLDDTLQVFILTNLLKSYKKNGKFEYEEKKLYYNLKQFTEDDFSIYYCFYKKYILGNEKRKTFSINGEIINKQLVKVVIKNFTACNILQNVSSINTGNNSNIELKVSLTKYSKKFFNILDVYFKEENETCNEILPIKENYNKLYTTTFIP